MSDYLGLADLLALGLDPVTARRVLDRSPLSGHGGQPVVEADHLADLLDALPQDEEGEP